MQYQTQHGLMEFGDFFFFFKEHSRGFNVKLAKAAGDETTSFQSVGAKVQVQILKIKHIFVANHL